MEIVPFSEIGRDRWDAFCAASREAWFRHRSAWIEYTVAMRQPGSSEDLSFGVIDGGRLVAAAPLIREAVHGRPDLSEFGFAGWNVPFPALADGLGAAHSDKIRKEIFREIDRLAQQHGIAYASFEVNPLSTLGTRDACSANPLPFFGYSATEIATHVIDLSPDEETLLRNMRKGHKSDISSARNSGWTASVLDRTNVTDRSFEVYRLIHLHAAGRQTRPERTWQLMRQWLADGFAVLGLVRKAGGEPVAAALSITDKDGAYYGSSCVEPEMEQERGIMHLLLWETMRSLKATGARWFETGWQLTPTISQEVPSRKEVNISLFKRGFGGIHVPYFRGERFYRDDYLREAYTGRALAYQREWMGRGPQEGGQEP